MGDFVECSWMLELWLFCENICKFYWGCYVYNFYHACFEFGGVIDTLVSQVLRSKDGSNIICHESTTPK
jgi:hypothetical protein